MHTLLICLVLTATILQTITCLGPIVQAPAHPVQPRTKSTTKKYLPTNSWFQNWLVGSGQSPIHTYPYILKASADGLQLCYPSQMVTNQKAYVLEVSIANLVLSTRESFNAPTLDVSTVNADFSYLSAKLNFGTVFSITAVRGSASLIAQINSATPVLATIHAIITNQKINDRAYKFSFNNGQTWLLQSEKAISWSVSSTEIFSQGVYSGWLKISIVTSSQGETALLDTHDLVITNGRVTHSVNRQLGEITIKCDYNSQGLYYILPHVLNPTNTLKIDGASAKGIKGTYLLSKGLGYQYKLPLFESSFKNVTLTSEQKLKLSESLKADVNLPIEAKDPYFGGKELARTARLIEIADLIGDSVSKSKAKDVLINELNTFWFSAKSALAFEPTWGGIVSNKSIGSPETDFGIYYYNDHHFHFGYFINAAATLAKHYPDYYASKSEYFNLLLADFAGTCQYAELPCKPRAKDYFLGHSYASGLFEFADSRNQESTSEAINAYYAVRELGIALKNQSLQDLGDYLLSTEIVATKTYWQIKSTNKIYPEPYSKNGVVGILWETKVDYATWFGGNVEFIYGIQMLPFTEITPSYLDRQWLTETRPVWSVPIDSAKIEEGWKGFLLLSDSIVDPKRNGLAAQINSLKSFDNGNTRTNTLYFYYMIGGSTSNTIINSSSITTTTTPSSIVGSSSSSSSICIGANCGDSLLQEGKPDSNCGIGLLGCIDFSGTLSGCYNPLTGDCFMGGNICPKPSKACYNPSDPKSGAPCYDPSLYDCKNGNLIYIGAGIGK